MYDAISDISYASSKLPLASVFQLGEASLADQTRELHHSINKIDVR